MSSVMRLAVVDPNNSTRSQLKNLVLGIDSVWLEAECSQYEFFSDVVLQTQPDIALISLDADPEKALELLEKLSKEAPDCSPLVVSSSQEGSLILRAMRNGAKEFLNQPPDIEEFMAALERLQQHSSSAEGGNSRNSQVISVAGVAGGVGCTSLAINIACMLAQDEQNSVVMIDLDLALGDADVWLDIIPEYTIQDVADNVSRLDYALLKRSLTKHESGTFLLPRPIQMESETRIAPESFQRVIGLLKATFTHLVIDLSKSFTPLDVAAMEASDSILLVTQLDLPCLRNVVRATQFFDAQERYSSRVKVVVNRAGLNNSQISLSKALDAIGREVYWQIPNDYATMVESRNNGIPLIVESPRAKLTKSIKELTDSVSGANVEEEGDQPDKKVKKKKAGLFSFLGGSK